MSLIETESAASSTPLTSCKREKYADESCFYKSWLYLKSKLFWMLVMGRVHNSSGKGLTPTYAFGFNGFVTFQKFSGLGSKGL